MLDIRNVVANLPAVEASMRKRAGEKFIPLLHDWVKADTERREAIQRVETLKARRNAASAEIAKIKKAKGDDRALMDEMKKASQEIKDLDGALGTIEARVATLALEFPNVLEAVVPEGRDAEANVEVRRWGTPKQFDFTPKTHDEIGEALGILDFKKAGEVTGSRFVFLKGIAARLERALINLMLDTHRKKGYEEIVPPFLVNRDALTGTGQLPKFEEDVFHIEKFGFFLIPTAEVPVTNYHRNEIIEADKLPIRYTAHTPCFRSEAGSYGRDTKGLKRQHQFDKVELVKFVKPSDSAAEHEALTKDAEAILQALNLPYRTMLLCAGDIGFGSAKTYDIEVWSPAANGFLEISSCSNFTDYQARRAGIRYRDPADKKVHFVHTLNGSGLAVGRTLLAIMENYQTKDGNFDIPEVLKPYL